jgi:hypothetical protein
VKVRFKVQTVEDGLARDGFAVSTLRLAPVHAKDCPREEDLANYYLWGGTGAPSGFVELRFVDQKMIRPEFEPGTIVDLTFDAKDPRDA